MVLRMISFGYKMVNGVLAVNDEEAVVVVEIFKRYGAGEILKGIADDLTTREVVFYQDKKVWNKNMIARIINNRKYIGEEGYPVIVSDEDFERANILKSQKGVKKVEYSPEVEYLKDVIVCSQCGKKLYRHATWSKREKWFCTNGCKNDIYIGDQEILDEILDAFIRTKDNMGCIEGVCESETYEPTMEIVRQNNEINRLIDQANVHFQAVKKLILQCVEMKFECCSENKAKSHTEYIKNCLDEWDSSDAVLPLMQKIVDVIGLEKDGAITITLINHAKIIGRK